MTGGSRQVLPSARGAWWSVLVLGAAVIAGCQSMEAPEPLDPPPPVDSTATLADTLAITPQEATIHRGDTIVFEAPERTVQGTPVSGPVTWTATGGTIDASGAFTATTTGTYLITAERGGKRGRTKARVTESSLLGVEITPGGVTVQQGRSQQYAVVGRFSDGTNTSVAVRWTATGGAISAGGLFTAGSTTGTYSVIATELATGLADTAGVTVVPGAATLTGVEVSPGTASVATGAAQQFSAVGRLSDGTTTSVSVTWSATGGTIDATGRFTAGATAGTYRVIATRTGDTMADTAQVTVTSTPPPPATLVGVEATPATVSVQAGQTQQFSVVGRRSDGTTQTVTATWTATGGTISASGLFTAGATAGTYRVIASASGFADTSTVTVTPPPATLVGVTVSPATAALQTGGTAQFSIVGRMSDGTTTPVTPTWSATGGTISAGGFYTAGGTAGTFRVIGSANGFADTSTVTLTAPAPTLTRVEVTPATASLQTGGTQQFSAIGRLSDNSTTAVSVTWSATGGTISAGGLYTAGGTAGTFRVIAVRVGDTMADTSTVTVTAPAPTLTAIEVTPATASLQTGATQQFSVIGRRSDGSTQSVTATWSATGGTISSGGLYTAGATAGSYRVIATSGSFADTSAVTLTAPPPGGGFASPDIANITFDDASQFGRLTVPGGLAFPSQTSWHTLDATGGRNGSAAMRVNVANTNYEPLGPQWAARGRVFVRYWFRASSGFLTASPSQHNVKGPRFHYNGGNLGVLKAEKLSWGFDEEAGGAQAATSMAWGLVPQDDRNAGIVPTCENLADGAWHSIEIDYDRNAGANVEVRMWCDGRAMVLPPGAAPFVSGVTYVGGDRTTNTPSTIRAPRVGPAALTDVTIFETVSQGFNGTIWIDDLAVSSQRIGP